MLVKKIREIILNLLIKVIKIYRLALSPLLISTRCRFEPTCSAYAVESLRKYGIFKGIVKLVIRIMKCNPLYRGNLYDPVR